MRLFSVMGAYALVANNELLHLCMFISLFFFKSQFLSCPLEEVITTEERPAFDAYVEKLSAQHTMLTWMHLGATIILTVARLHGYLKNLYDAEQSKV